MHQQYLTTIPLSPSSKIQLTIVCLATAGVAHMGPTTIPETVTEIDGPPDVAWNLQLLNSTFSNYDYMADWSSSRLEELYKIQRDARLSTNIALTSFLVPLFICGLIGNTLVLAVFFRCKLKHASAFLIMALATNDLIICCLVLPGVLLKEWFVPFQWEVLCKGWEWVRCASIPLSCLILVAVAVDRYILICHAGELRAMSVKQAKFIILLSVVLSVCHSVLPMLRVGVYQAGADNRTIYLGLCLVNDLLVGQSIIDHYWQLTTGEFLLVLITTAVMYSLVFRTVYRQSKKWSGDKSYPDGMSKFALDSKRTDSGFGDNFATQAGNSTHSNCLTSGNSPNSNCLISGNSPNSDSLTSETKEKHDNIVNKVQNSQVVTPGHVPTGKRREGCEVGASDSEILDQETLSDHPDLCVPESLHKPGFIGGMGSSNQNCPSDSHSQCDNDHSKVCPKSKCTDLTQDEKKLPSILTTSSQTFTINNDILMSSGSYSTNSETLTTVCDVDSNIRFPSETKHAAQTNLTRHDSGTNKLASESAETVPTMRLNSWVGQADASSFCQLKKHSPALTKLRNRKTHPISQLSSSRQQGQITPPLLVTQQPQRTFLRIVRQLHRNIKQHRSKQQQQQQQQPGQHKRYTTAQVKTAKVLLLVTAAYIISFMPVLLMMLNAVPSHPIPFYCYFIHSAANPLIYSFSNQTFRRQLTNLVWGKKR